MRSETGAVIRLEDYRPSDYLIESTKLFFTLNATATTVRATLSIRRREGVAPQTPLVLAGDELRLQSLQVDGTAADES